MRSGFFGEGFEEYLYFQQKLIKILLDAAEVVGTLNMPEGKELADLNIKVQSDSFKVMVTGNLKSGKSTFINALLGEKILPAYAPPCTGVITEVKYGTEKRAVLHFRDPLPSSLPSQLADKAVSHMDEYKGKQIPPLEVLCDEIWDYITTPIETDTEQMKLQLPYKKVEFFYPLDILEKGMEIIDFPGLNEDETRINVIMDYLNKVDAVLYVVNAQRIYTRDEMEFVEKSLAGNYFGPVIFVVNKIDMIP